ncbi:hypothetical protein ACRN93_06520 [Shewanella baltica]|uniref:hypothetical protein n=1 Tax=Shewanella baltica TaxID=62322 RepID=UPI003D79B8C1
MGPVILVVSSLAFADIHSHRLAMAFARRLAASPSLDARPPVHGADGRLANHHGSPFGQ